MKRSVLILIVLAAGAGTSWAENWPAFRGPRRDGHSAEKSLPLTWSATENVRWKIELPAPGNSSPVIWGDRIFVSTPLDKKGHQRALLCFDRKDGKKLWQRDVEYGPVEPTYAPFYYAQATPVTDGQRVVVSYGSAGLYCYDMDGAEQWHYDLGKLYHVWANASAPLLYRDLVILWCGPGERNFLIAIDKATGKKVWQHDEPAGKADAFAGSWSTPMLAKINGADELIVCVSKAVKGFDPATGAERWSCSGLGALVYTTPAVTTDGIVVAFGGYGGPALAVRAGGKGDVTATHRLWLHDKVKHAQRIGSPVIVGDHCYLVSETGQAHCFEVKTGKDVWAGQKLDLQTWSSLIATADGKLLIPGFAGETFVLEASPQFKLIGRNALAKDRVNASIAISDGELFIRSYKYLWCIGKQAAGTANPDDGGKQSPPAKPRAEPTKPTAHTDRKLEGWTIRVDDRLLAGPDAALGTRALRFLEARLSDIKVVVPQDKVKKLQSVVIVLDLTHGKLGAMQYHPSAGWLKANGYATDLAKCVHIPRAADLPTKRNINEQPWVILHELAHAYHDQVLGFDEPRIREAYENYKTSGHGDKTLLYNGQRVKHYALTNHKEFFAEMTEAYFGVNDFFPFNQAELKEAEPAIYKLLRNIWESPVKKGT